MRQLFVLMVVVLSGSLMASEPIPVTVTMPIDGKSKDTLVLIAKSQAILDAMDKLPSVVWGEESASNQHYKNAIKAVGFAQADVAVDSELFDAANNQYTLKASVSLEDEKIKQMLSSVSAGERAKKTVSQLNQLLNSIDLHDHLSLKITDKHTEAKLLADQLLFADDLAAQIEHQKRLVAKMKALYDEQAARYAQQYSIAFVGIWEDFLEYTLVEPPAPWDGNLHFETDELNAFYKKNRGLIATDYYLCSLSMVTSTLSWRVKRLSDKDPIPNFLLEPSDDLVKKKRTPIYFSVCTD